MTHVTHENRIDSHIPKFHVRKEVLDPEVSEVKGLAVIAPEKIYTLQG